MSIQTPIFEFIKGYLVFFYTLIKDWILNPYSPHFEWVRQIKSKFGFLRFVIKTFRWERIRKTGVYLTSGFPFRERKFYFCDENKIITSHDRDYERMN